MPKRPAAVTALAAFIAVSGVTSFITGAESAEPEIAHALEVDSCAERLSLLQTRAGSLRSRPASDDTEEDDDTRGLSEDVASGASSIQDGAEAWASAADSLASLVGEAIADSPGLGGVGGFELSSAGVNPFGSSGGYVVNSGIPPLGSAADVASMLAPPSMESRASSPPSTPVVKIMTQNGEVEIPIVTVNRTDRHARHRVHRTQRHLGMLSTKHTAEQVERKNVQGDRVLGTRTMSVEPPLLAIANDTVEAALKAKSANKSANGTLEAAWPTAVGNSSADTRARLLRNSAVGIDAQLQKLSSQPAEPTNSSTEKIPAPYVARADAKSDSSKGNSPAEFIGRAPSASTDADGDDGRGMSAEELLRVAREVTDELHRTAEAEHHRHRHRAHNHHHRRTAGRVRRSRRGGAMAAEGNLEPAAEVRVDPLCARARALNFHGSGVAASNLGGQGPDEGYHWLVFTNVTSVNGSQVDLEVIANSSYAPFDNTKNGLNGPFGVINLGVNSKVDLRFSFVNHSTGVPVVLEPFYFTFFDFDQGFAHGARETVTVSGSEAFMLSDNTEVEVDQQTEDGTVVFASSMRGGKLDNPVFPGTLTHLQEDRSVTLLFKNSSDFLITLEELGYLDLKGGRNFLFSGPSELACPQEHRCTEYQCPEGYHIRTMAEFLLCEAERCSDRDLDTCCYDASSATSANSTKDLDAAPGDQ